MITMQVNTSNLPDTPFSGGVCFLLSVYVSDQTNVAADELYMHMPQ